MNRLLGDEELAQEVIAIFLDDIPLQIAAIRETMQHEDAARIKHQAHNLKGASANMSAGVLRELAFQIETAAKTNHLEQVKSLLNQFENQLEILKTTLNNLGYLAAPEDSQ